MVQPRGVEGGAESTCERSGLSDSGPAGAPLGLGLLVSLMPPAENSFSGAREGGKGEKGEGKEGRNHPRAKARPFPPDSCSEGAHGSQKPRQPPLPHPLHPGASGL